MRKLKPSAILILAGAVLLFAQGCSTLRPSVRANLKVPGQDVSYEFNGIREGPSSYHLGDRTFSPKSGYHFFTAFVTVSNQTRTRTVVDMDMFVLFDQNKKFYYPALVYLNEFDGMESPFLDKVIDTNKSVSAGLIYILTDDSQADRLMLPSQVEIKLPSAPKKE